MKPANSRLKSIRLATFRSTVRQIESILHRSTISSSHAKQVKSKLVQLEGHFEQLLKWNRQLEAREVRGQNKATQLVPSTATTSQPNPLARLPDLCLLALFGQLPLLDQLTARQTCARWSTLILEVTQTRRTLDINLHRGNKKVNYTETKSVYDGIPDAFWLRKDETISFLQADDGSPLFPCRRLTAWSRLSVASLPATLNQQIVTTFRRIRKLKLTVYTKKPDNAEHLVNLVEQLGPHLETFHLHFTCPLLSEPLTDRLYAAINSMSSLLYLNLELDCHISHRNLPIISRLEELHFDCTSTPPSQFAKMLQRYGRGNGALRRIVYRYMPVFHMQMAPFTRLSGRLRHCFTGFDYYNCDTRQWMSLCDHFISLTSLDITLTHISADLAKLSQLTQLIALRLTLHFTDARPEIEPLHRRPLPQLPSVAHLHLRPRFQSHRDLDQLALPWTMPNLQVIYFDFGFSKCTDCHETSFPINRMPANLESVKECTRQLFRPLMAQCARLRLIRHSEEEVLGTAEELLA